jgi:hypothetical protein
VLITYKQKIYKPKKIKKMEGLKNWQVLGTTLLVTVVGVLIALKVNAQINAAKLSAPVASK